MEGVKEEEEGEGAMASCRLYLVSNVDANPGKLVTRTPIPPPVGSCNIANCRLCGAPIIVHFRVFVLQSLESLLRGSRTLILGFHKFHF